MTTLAPRTESSFTLAPEGPHLARCISFIHIGTNMDEYMGEAKEFNKIRLTFELPEETKVFKEEEGPKPLVVSQEYTLSMSEKANLRKLVEGIIGTSLHDDEAYAFDVESIVGMPCLITIKNKTSKAGKVRNEIASASKLMKNQVAPPQVNPSKILSFSNWNEELFNKQPEFIKEKIMSSKEYKEMKGISNDDNQINPEEIPF